MPYNDYTQAYAPIIQAMIASSEANAAERKRADVKTQNTEENAQRQEQIKQNKLQLDEVIRQHDIESQHQKDLYELGKRKFDLDFDAHQFTKRVEIGKGVREGTLKVGPDGNIAGITGAPTGVENYTTPEQAQVQDLAGFQKKTDITRGSTEEAEQARFNRELAVHTADRNSAERIAALNAQTSQANSIRSAQARLHAASLGAGNIDESALGSYANDLFFTGNTKESAIPQKVRTAIRRAYPGFSPIDQGDKAALDGIPEMNSTLDDADKLLEAAKGLGGNLKTMIPGTEAYAAAQRVQGRLGVLARGISKEKGVLTQPDIQRAAKLEFSIGNSDEANAKNVADLRLLVNKVIKSKLAKYSPEQQQNILLKRNLNPDDYVSGGGGGGGGGRIEYEPGKYVPDTPENRKKYGL